MNSRRYSEGGHLRGIRGRPVGSDEKHLARTVHDLYFEPKYEEFESRTIWSLSSAFTSAFKELDPIPQFRATAKLENSGDSVLTIVLACRAGEADRPFLQAGVVCFLAEKRRGCTSRPTVAARNFDEMLATEAKRVIEVLLSGECGGVKVA